MERSSDRHATGPLGDPSTVVLQVAHGDFAVNGKRSTASGLIDSHFAHYRNCLRGTCLSRRPAILVRPAIS